MLCTVDLGQTGNVVEWMICTDDGTEIERLRIPRATSVVSHTWNVTEETAKTVRDMLCFITKADYKENSPL